MVDVLRRRTALLDRRVAATLLSQRSTRYTFIHSAPARREISSTATFQPRSTWLERGCGPIVIVYMTL